MTILYLIPDLIQECCTRCWDIAKFGRHEWVIIFHKAIYYTESILRIPEIELLSERAARSWNDSIQIISRDILAKEQFSARKIHFSPPNSFVC